MRNYEKTFSTVDEMTDMAVKIVNNYRRYHSVDTSYIFDAVEELNEKIEEDEDIECILEYGIIVTQTTNSTCDYFEFVNPPIMILLAIVKGEDMTWQVSKHIKI